MSYPVGAKSLNFCSQSTGHGAVEAATLYRSNSIESPWVWMTAPACGAEAPAFGPESEAPKPRLSVREMSATLAPGHRLHSSSAARPRAPKATSDSNADRWIHPSRGSSMHLVLADDGAPSELTACRLQGRPPLRATYLRDRKVPKPDVFSKEKALVGTRPRSDPGGGLLSLRQLGHSSTCHG